MTISGQKAEAKVAEFLESKGHVIIARNWRTKWCEVDIITKYKSTIFFTEVKYRSNTNQGSGFDYITKAKLSKLTLGVKSWQAVNEWPGDVRLLAASVSGINFDQIEFKEIY